MIPLSKIFDVEAVGAGIEECTGPADSIDRRFVGEALIHPPPAVFPSGMLLPLIDGMGYLYRLSG